jgi:hypothetical protein
MSSKFKLFQAVLDNSISKDINEAISEWDIMGYNIDHNVCVCGKEDIKYCYVIQNRINNNVLYPIGKKCIRKFNNDNITDKAKIFEKKTKIFKNKGKKCDGLEYDVICNKHKDYIDFLLKTQLRKKIYKDLVEYYKIVYEKIT